VIVHLVPFYTSFFLFKGGLMKRKNEKGFTLVEVIVVAVIVAVLAAVAIPLYMGYIRDSRIDVGNNIAGTINSAAGASTQQEVVFVPINGAGPVPVIFPNRDATTNNTIQVPAGYTITWVDAAPGTPAGPGTVEVSWTAYGVGTGTTYTYK
jgi:prepilin-type N-terminal cleavage/methylation domain-containing protein